MGLLDIFKAKENKLLKEENERLVAEINSFKNELGDNYKEVSDKLQIINNLNIKISDLKLDIKNKEENIYELNSKISDLSKEIIQLDDENLYQSFGLYEPLYDFATSELYKDTLNKLRQNQKLAIKNNTAVSFCDNWTVDGSRTKGRKMNNNNIKQILRSFNCECENVIDRVKFNNIDSMKSRITKAFEQLNSLNDINRISIRDSYLKMKLDELSLAYEYQVKKQEEKEEQKRIRAELKEQAIAQKELEEARKNTLKDKEHYEKAIENLVSQIACETNEEKKIALLSKKEELESNLKDINLKLEDIDFRQKNQKAGYVYIISNIGSFGKDIYKIGMTRRLEPSERIDELSDASVPFNFDIHAMIFTEDAPALENALHKAFENKKVNMINHRREFFNVSLDEIKSVISKNFDKTVEFRDIPEAEQYRQTQKIKSQFLSNADNNFAELKLLKLNNKVT